MPSRKSDVRRSDVSAATISNHHAPAGDAEEDSPMTSVPPLQSESSATPAAVAPTTAVTFAPPLPTEHAAPESPGVVVRAESNAGTSEKGKDREGAVTIEDLNLPKSIITRLAKGVLPPNTQIQANAILALSKSATVFISHLSNAANEWTQSGGKKTIMPADVFRALDDIEYGFMRERLEAEFAKFNEVQSTKRSAYRRKVSAAKRAARQANGDVSVADSSVLSRGGDDDDEEDAMDETHVGDTTMGTTVSAADDNGGGGGARATKKARVDNSAGGAKMDVDKNGEVSDAETVPDEHVEDDDEDDEDEQEEEDDEEEEEEEEGGQGEDDELEERGGREVEDEALDEDSE